MSPESKSIIAILAASIGSVILGVLIVLSEAFPAFKKTMTFHDGVGPLSGKTTLAALCFFLCWWGLYFIFSRTKLNEQKAITISFALIFLSLVFSFPPFFELFTAH